MTTKPNQVVDALEILCYYGLNTRLALMTDKEAFKLADELVERVLTNKDTPENVKKAIMACFDGGYSASQDFA